MNKQLEELSRLGQSVWIDDLSKRLLLSGGLASLIEAGVVGLTSNPSIFRAAIAESAEYDEEIKAGKSAGRSVDDLCEDLMVADVAAAVNLFRPVYDRTKGVDGLVSLEVSPLLAHDTAGTVAAARRLWGRLSRPNVMIKVPATKEGLPAIATLLTEGINVNITLIFATSVYRQVIEAYLTALEARLARGEPINTLASVASFFVSRVDTIVEKELGKLAEGGKIDPEGASRFTGKVAIENSFSAYDTYLEFFNSPRFKKLQSAGGRVQRPLWASTSTKNPSLPPLLYVESLVGADTVNTVPPKTLAQLLQGGEIKCALPGSKQRGSMISALLELGVNFEGLLEGLERQGVDLFAEAYRSLIDALQIKLAKLS